LHNMSFATVYNQRASFIYLNLMVKNRDVHMYYKSCTGTKLVCVIY
jgi:hypothetical protein